MADQGKQAMYATEATTPLRPLTADDKPPSLMERGDALTSRLRDILGRLDRIADTFFGAVPSAVENGKPAGAVSVSLNRHLDIAHNTAAEIEAVISRIENRL